MYVRLAFAVAAHLEPEILIVDEVLAVGDAEFQKKCLGKMQSVAVNENRTVLFVSHSLQAVQSLCDRAILLNSGTVEAYGTSRAVVGQYLTARAISRRRKSVAVTCVAGERCVVTARDTDYWRGGRDRPIG